ncbi:helix-turn-helix domain-containing protein [Sporosarcina sp. FSL W7-1283]|uniref:helix-turn-helix domain-containing protein n=1 Tax=Sporosarcina sp. FSL W7-1283 TaxID=2921560 RepID=UPI0030F764AB
MRVSKGLSRYRLAKLTGLRESTLQNIEKSESPNPTFRVTCAIADALEMSLDELRKYMNT